MTGYFRINPLRYIDFQSSGNLSGSGQINILQLQLPGGKALSAEQVLNARSELFAPGNCFSLPAETPA